MGKTANVIEIFGDRVRRAADHFDGFVNKVTALGTGRDKMSFNRFVHGARLDTETMDALYSENAEAARICDVVPEEELRQGFDVVIAPDAEEASGQEIEDASSASEAVHDAADALGVASKMIEARVWGRVFGGGALLLGADDGATKENGRLREPLNEEAITSFDHINVLDRRYLHPLTYYEDPTSPKFSRPQTYLVTPQAIDSVSAAHVAGLGTLEMHETRLVVFGGTRTTIQTRQTNSGWDTSVLQRIDTALTQFGVSWDALAHLLQDANQATFKMKGFIDALAANETEMVMKRLSIMDMTRSVMRAVVLDDEEEFERQNFTWTGIKDPYELLMLRLAAASRMPVTILMGQSPAGMDATGESDIRWFYDTIRTSQTNEVRPALERVLSLIMLAKDGPTSGQLPESWSVTFPSLWQMTPAEQATLEKTTAERDEIYIRNEVVTPEEVAVSRFTPDGWRSETSVQLDERRAIIEGDLGEDIENTPTLGADGEPAPEENVQQQALAGGQTAQLIDLAAKVQAGTIDRESAIALVVNAYPSIDEEAAGAIVGDVDPEKVAAREALIASAPAPGQPPKPAQTQTPRPTPETEPED